MLVNVACTVAGLAVVDVTDTVTCPFEPVTPLGVTLPAVMANRMVAFATGAPFDRYCSVTCEVVPTGILVPAAGLMKLNASALIWIALVTVAPAASNLRLSLPALVAV